MERSYETAVNDLNNLQSNASIIKEINENRGNLFKNSIPEMHEYLDLIGYKAEELDQLNIIHITGTKGKGSTAAFCQNILKNCNLKTGLFTSPHMIEVRERIRINGIPLDRKKFCTYFYYCYDRLIGKKKSKINPYLPGPSYFRFLTLLAFHAFIQEKVQATILEVGIGGEYDSTNIILHPKVTGISHLGLDHTNLLGNTIQEIAWHKAGIMKTGSPAFTVKQLSKEASKVLVDRANEKKVSLEIVKPLTEYSNFNKLNLALSGSHQLENASLAYELCQSFLNKNKTNEIPESVITSLNNTTWPGRSQRYIDTYGIEWYLDGAHTTDSIELSIKWYLENYDPELPTYILFNGAKDRDAKLLFNIILREVKKKNVNVSNLILCPNIVGSVQMLDSVNHTLENNEKLEIQNQLKQIWEDEYKDKKSSIALVFPTIQIACDTIQQKINKTSQNKTNGLKAQVLVTGSLHLVGGVMSVLKHPVV
ncbi:FolC bifunctional protein [Neoconidiobolus thromboides FSU 785]|nr:FolC bifunctional protein [Neoconidiobolus thromboides FSU 785]